MNTKTCLIMILMAISGFCGLVIAADCEQFTLEQLTNNDTDDTDIRVSGNNAVWVGKDSEGYKQIFFYNGNETIKVTDSNGDNTKPQINGKKIVWQGQDSDGDWEIFYYKNGCLGQITNNSVDDINPRLSGTRIFWERHDGNDSEIMSAAIPKDVKMIVTPRTINLKSKGKLINVKVIMDSSNEAVDVNLASLRFLGIPASKVVVSARYNTLTIKFDRQQVQAQLETGNSVEVILTGKLNDGTVFTATDSIKVINPGQSQSYSGSASFEMTHFN